MMDQKPRPGVSIWANARFGDLIAPNGKPAWQNFVRWLGDSKVVDANGKPLVMYHGSTQDISEFDTAGEGDEVGAFFTTNPASLSEYTDGDGGNVTPVYLRVTNPYEVTADQWNSGEGLSPRAARRAGYDGYIVRGQDAGDTYIAFRPEQIKSAIGNNGDFSDSADISE